MRSALMFCAAFFAVLLTFGCAATKPVPSPKPAVQSAAAPALPEILPFNIEKIPAGWTFAGPGAAIVFVNPEYQAQVQFSFFPGVAITPADFVKKIAEQAASDPLTKIVPAACEPASTECSARITMSRGGEKSGWLVVRTFPGCTVYSVALMGLWPVEFEETLAPDFEIFKGAMRLK